jgi:hypothetical protein
MAESGDTFAHEQLDRSLQQIRLISIIPEADGPIRFNIKYADLEANPTPEYRALSYVWGPPTHVREIFVNDQSFTVRLNLYNFLLAFRTRLVKFNGGGQYEDEVQWLWIDQICINQAVVEERNHQVQMMSTIYAKASYVYLWLGPSDSDTEAVMRLIKSDFRHYYSCRPRTHQQNDTIIHSDRGKAGSFTATALQQFFGNPYWTRLWIVQEIMLARYIRIFCGETLLSWDEIRRFCSGGLRRLPMDAVQAVPLQVKWLAEHALSAKMYSYSELLWTFHTSQCEDARDRVFGLQGLLEQAHRIEINYAKTTECVFSDVVVSMTSFPPKTWSPPLTERPYGARLEELDYGKPVEQVFVDAVAIMMEDAEKFLQVRLVETLVVLRESMGLDCSGKLMRRLKEKDYSLSTTRSMWQQVAWFYRREFSFLPTNEDYQSITSGEFYLLEHELANQYTHLAARVRWCFSEMSPSNGSAMVCIPFHKG